MADSAPVNEVLCEAIQYLLKLGTNLRQRSEVLRDKRIRKDKLRNTHAVQKATSKVLVLCELAKKSIVNVESSVKAIQDRIDNMQANNTGGKTSSSQKVSFYEYFTFKSKRLKCRNKINIKLYTSAKVSVSKMLASIQDKYPVFYDCKLFRQRIKSEKIADKNSNADEKHLDKKRRIEEFDSRRHSDSMQTDEQIDHQSSSNVNVKDTHKASKVDHSSKEGKCMSENGETEQLDTIACRDNCLQDTCNDSDEVKNKKTCETSVEKKERKSRSTMKNISDKTKKYLDSISKCHNNKQNNVLEEICSDNESTHRNVDDSNKACNSEMEDNCKNKMLNKNKSDCSKKANNKEKEGCNSDGNSKRSNTEDRLFIANNKSAMSKDKNENEESTNEIIEKCNDSIELSGTKNNLTEEEAFTENQHSKSYESDRSMDSDVSKKSYIKCVNINKLLRPDKIISSSTVLSNEVNKTKRGSKKIREKCSKKYNTKSRSNENYEAQNAKLDAIKNFKPKSFSINIVRLPKLNDKFLRSQNLTRINQFVPHNIEIIQSKEQDDRSIKTYKNKVNEKKFKILQDNENQGKDIDSRKNENLKKNENQEKDIDSIKNALLNVSDSENTDEDIRQVNENVKKSLLVESDSDKSTRMQEKENDNSNDETKSPNSSNPTSTQSNSVDEKNIANNDKEIAKNKTSELNNEHYETNSQRVLITPDKQTEEKLENSDIEKTSLPPNNRVLRTPDDKRNQGNEGTTPPSTRKRIMESMHAKKMLLTYSSSDTEDEQLKNAFKEIKDALLKGNSSSDEERQQSKQCHRKLSSESDVSLINERITKDAKHLKSRSKRKREKSRSSNSGRSQQEESTESSSNKVRKK